MGRPVIHWELWTRTLEKTCDFYKQVFDWKIQPSPTPRYNIVETGGQGGINGGIMTPQRSEPWPGNMSFYILVDDLADYRQRVAKAGGKILVEEEDVPGMGSYSLFSDPDGRLMGLWKVAAAMKSHGRASSRSSGRGSKKPSGRSRARVKASARRRSKTGALV